MNLFFKTFLNKWKEGIDMCVMAGDSNMEFLNLSPTHSQMLVQYSIARVSVPRNFDFQAKKCEILNQH